MKRLVVLSVLLLSALVVRASAQSQVTWVSLFDCGLTYNEIYNNMAISGTDKEFNFAGINISRRWITTPETDDRSHIAQAYLTGSINWSSTSAFVQLQYSPDAGTTWIDTPLTFSLAIVGDRTGNIAVLPADLCSRGPVLLRLIVRGGAPEEQVMPLSLALVILN